MQYMARKSIGQIVIIVASAPFIWLSLASVELTKARPLAKVKQSGVRTNEFMPGAKLRLLRQYVTPTEYFLVTLPDCDSCSAVHADFQALGEKGQIVCLSRDAQANIQAEFGLPKDTTIVPMTHRQKDLSLPFWAFAGAPRV